MTEQDYGTIKVDRETFEEHNERRKELGLTWDQYLNHEQSDSGLTETQREEVQDLIDSRLRELR